MTDKQLARAMDAINWQIMAPNYLKEETSELESRGLMEFRQGAWRTTASGRRFLREIGA